MAKPRRPVVTAQRLHIPPQPTSPVDFDAFDEEERKADAARAAAVEASPTLELRIALGDANHNGKADLSVRALVAGRPRTPTLVKDIDEGMGLMLLTGMPKAFEVAADIGIDHVVGDVVDMVSKFARAGDLMKKLGGLGRIF
jgi:hypothetical protein